jgi:FkbM family methyltransferase
MVPFAPGRSAHGLAARARRRYHEGPRGRARPPLRTSTKIAVARTISRVIGVARAATSRSMRVRVRRDGIAWDLDLTEGIDLYLYLAGRFEWRLSRVLTGLVRPGDTVVDVGANMGAHTLPLARAAGPDGRVIAYEPTAFAYRKLLANIALNPDLASRIVPVQAMLVGARSEQVMPAVYSSWPLVAAGDLHAEHLGRAMATDGARAITLDDHLRELEVEKIHLVKIDVDGSECSVLRGAREVLGRWRPVLVMEWAPYIHQAAGHRLEDCLSVVRELGYSFQDAESGQALPADLSRVNDRVGVSINVLGRV